MIYFIQCGPWDGPIKIGYAGSVRMVHTRLGLFQCGHPEKLTLLGYVEGDKSVEREYHRMFAADRLRREWFNYSDDLRIVATDRNWARDALDRQQSVERWNAWGLTRRDGSLTRRGRVYLMDMERNLLEHGVDLEGFVLDALQDYADEFQEAA